MYNLRYGSDLSLTCKKLCMFLNYKTLGSLCLYVLTVWHAEVEHWTRICSPRLAAIRFDSTLSQQSNIHSIVRPASDTITTDYNTQYSAT